MGNLHDARGWEICCQHLWKANQPADRFGIGPYSAAGVHEPESVHAMLLEPVAGGRSRRMLRILFARVNHGAQPTTCKMSYVENHLILGPPTKRCRSPPLHLHIALGIVMSKAWSMGVGVCRYLVGYDAESERRACAALQELDTQVGLEDAGDGSDSCNSVCDGEGAGDGKGVGGGEGDARLPPADGKPRKGPSVGQAGWKGYDGPTTCPHGPSGRDTMLRFGSILAREVKFKMGPCPKQTEANRLVAWELLGKECAARDVRKVDRGRYMSYALPMVFIPDIYEVEATKYGRSRTVGERLDEVKEKDAGVYDWLFGRKPGLRYRAA